jgi:hypothetical protein
MVAARIATLALFAVGFHAWLFLLLGTCTAYNIRK